LATADLRDSLRHPKEAGPTVATIEQAVQAADRSSRGPTPESPRDFLEASMSGAKPTGAHGLSQWLFPNGQGAQVTDVVSEVDAALDLQAMRDLEGALRRRRDQ